MIKTRIFQFVGHIHNMQLCIEMISFINHENESILRWFYRFCEPRNFSLCPRNLVGVYSGGLGVWFMTFCCCLVEFGFSCFNHASIESWFANYSVLDILHVSPSASNLCVCLTLLWNYHIRRDALTWMQLWSRRVCFRENLFLRSFPMETVNSSSRPLM